jgi:hypothetical protein
MQNLKEFEAYMDKNFSGDDWADGADEDAIRLLKKFNAEEWETLKTLWRQKSASWLKEKLENYDGYYWRDTLKTILSFNDLDPL